MIEEYGLDPFIDKCKESVWKYKGMWEDFSGTVGFWADMDDPYVTYHDDFIESEWWALKTIWDKGLLYKGFKIVPYCPRCGTALSSHDRLTSIQSNADVLVGVFEDEDGKNNPEAFNNKPAWKRIIVLVSGVTFNFLFGILTAAIYLFVTGYATPKISSVINSTEKTGSGLYQNDIIIAVDGKKIENYRSLDSMISKFDAGETFTLTVERDGKIIDVGRRSYRSGCN